jgi:hypothetical protein
MPTQLTADKHMGFCDACPAAINWGYQYVQYDEGGKYHLECDPFREPRVCKWGCGTITEYEPAIKGAVYAFSSECQPCYSRIHWWLYSSSIPQLARALFGGVVRKDPFWKKIGYAD